QDVVLFDLRRSVQVGGGAGDAPGAVEAAGGEAPLVAPALERPARRRCEARDLAETRGLELRVQAALSLELAPARGDDPFANRRRPLTFRLRGEQLELHPPHGHLEVDPVEQRAGQPALVGVDSRERAAAGPDAIAGPAARAWIGRSDQREARGIGDRSAGPGDGHAACLDGLAERLQNWGLKLRQLVEEQHSVVAAADPPGQRQPATSRARFASSWPWTSARSCSGSGVGAASSTIIRDDGAIGSTPSRWLTTAISDAHGMTSRSSTSAASAASAAGTKTRW